MNESEIGSDKVDVNTKVKKNKTKLNVNVG